jgi:hypothetical protein
MKNTEKITKSSIALNGRMIDILNHNPEPRTLDLKSYTLLGNFTGST